jgi:hypothetical protein
MLKNITRQLQALLSRHLPRRLTQRDPLPNAKNIAGAAIPAALTERCLNVAAMDENEVWRAFGGHPEGLNAAEVEKSAPCMAITKFRRKSLPRGGCTCGPATATRSTCC